MENFRVNFNVKGKKLDRSTDILLKLAMNKIFSVKNLADKNEVSVRTVREDIRDLKDFGLIEFKG
ncbi:MAG: HTH domain-containing protein, partial [Thermoplasmatota archaeon]